MDPHNIFEYSEQDMVEILAANNYTIKQVEARYNSDLGDISYTGTVTIAFLWQGPKIEKDRVPPIEALSKDDLPIKLAFNKFLRQRLKALLMAEPPRPRQTIASRYAELLGDSYPNLNPNDMP